MCCSGDLEKISELKIHLLFQIKKKKFLKTALFTFCSTKYSSVRGTRRPRQLESKYIPYLNQILNSIPTLDTGPKKEKKKKHDGTEGNDMVEVKKILIEVMESIKKLKDVEKIKDVDLADADYQMVLSHIKN